MASITVTTNALEKAAAMRGAAAETPIQIESMMRSSGSAAGPLAAEILKSVTPVRTGKLRDSTSATVRPRGFYVSIELRQPATSKDGVQYGDIVRSGRRGFAAADYGKRSLGPMDGIGFRASVGPAAANPYDQQALGPIRSMARQILTEEGVRCANRIGARMAG